MQNPVSRKNTSKVTGDALAHSERHLGRNGESDGANLDRKTRTALAPGQDRDLAIGGQMSRKGSATTLKRIRTLGDEFETLIPEGEKCLSIMNQLMKAVDDEPDGPKRDSRLRQFDAALAQSQGLAERMVQNVDEHFTLLLTLKDPSDKRVN